MIRAPRDETPAIELTPIVDMVFLLLIFFLVATTFHQTERELAIELPEAASGTPISVALRELVVNIDASGAVVVSGRPLEVDALQELVREAVAANPEQKVAVRADQRAEWSAVVRALDAVRSGGVQSPWLDTIPAGS
jgi:biopolymer transport protein ExbD